MRMASTEVEEGGKKQLQPCLTLWLRKAELTVVAHIN